MKNLGIIYLIFMVLLSALPCNDEVENKGFAARIISEVKQKHSQEAENCSSICVCSCCGQSVIEPRFITFEIEIPTIELADKIANYQFSLQQRGQNIWQPPKLALIG